MAEARESRSGSQARFPSVLAWYLITSCCPKHITLLSPDSREGETDFSSVQGTAKSYNKGCGYQGGEGLQGHHCNLLQALWPIYKAKQNSPLGWSTIVDSRESSREWGLSHLQGILPKQACEWLGGHWGPPYTLKSLLTEYLEFSSIKSWPFLIVSLNPGS